MQEDLVGYLLHALEPGEQARVEASLAQNPDLQVQLTRLRAFLSLLECDRAAYSPPPGLAQRTCRLVRSRTSLEDRRIVVPARWRVFDLMVAAAIVAAAAMLFFPAVAQSRHRSRVIACQNNLRVIGQALGSYSQRYDGCFPAITLVGNLGAAGIYGPMLLETGFLDSPRWLGCPGCTQGHERLRVPTLAELRSAAPKLAVELHRRMGGGYAYGLGYIQNGTYYCLRNEGRACVPIMADAPGDSLGCASANHGCGQNVLFEDLHVMYLVGCEYAAGDHIYLNRLGVMAAGIGPDDAVLGRSDTHPLAALTGALTLPKAPQGIELGKLPLVPYPDGLKPRPRPQVMGRQ